MTSHAGSDDAPMHDGGLCREILGNNVAVWNMLFWRKALGGGSLVGVLASLTLSVILGA